MNKRQIVKGLAGLARVLLLIFCVSFAAFFLLAVSPMDPLQSNVGQAALGSMSQEQIDKLREYWRMNTPMAVRFLNWAWENQNLRYTVQNNTHILNLVMNT